MYRQVSYRGKMKDELLSDHTIYPHKPWLECNAFQYFACFSAYLDIIECRSADIWKNSTFRCLGGLASLANKERVLGTCAMHRLVVLEHIVAVLLAMIKD